MNEEILVSTDAHSVKEYVHVLCHTVLVDSFRSPIMICGFVDQEHSWHPSMYQQCWIFIWKKGGGTVFNAKICLVRAIQNSQY